MSTKLLFADDSVTMQKVIQLTLENEDISVLIAGDGEDAFRLAESEKPNIIIADVAMPGMDGFKLCEKVKQTPSTSDIPVILISGELEQYDDDRGREVGADYHITKPFKSEELINAIKEFAAEAPAASGGERGGADEDRGEAKELQSVETELEQELSQEEESDGIVAEAVADNGQEPPILELTDASAASSEDLSGEPDEELEIVDDDLDDSPDDEADETEELAEVDELDVEGLGEVAEAPEEETAEEAAVAAQESPQEASAEREEQLFDVEDLPEVAEIADAEIPEIGETPEESESMEEILKEEIAMRPEPDELQEKPDVADQILTDVFKGTDDDEPSGDLDGIAQETAQGVVDEVGEVSETPEEAPSIDMGIDIGEAVRESVASAVGDFMREEAPAILRDALRESIDSSFKSVLESELENAIKEELGKMIGESLRSIIPEILKMTEKVATQITPKIAEEMIKIAIEKIKKGDDA